MSDITTKKFTFEITASNDVSIELAQLISLSIQECSKATGSDLPCDVVSTIKYFTHLYGVKL